jgi:signal peptidase I
MSKERLDRRELRDEPPASRGANTPRQLTEEQPVSPSKPPTKPLSPARRYERRIASEARRLHMLREILETVTLTILLFLVFRFAVQNYRVDGHSMMPTLQDQQYILVNRAAYLFHPPERGDVIVFAYPLDPTQDYVKRVIGIPGDHVQVEPDGTVIVNGVRLQEPYITPSPDPYTPTDIILGANQYFVLGDNRGDSSDSRVWGPVPRQNIIGKALLVYWPLGNFHFIPDESTIFSAIKPR